MGNEIDNRIVFSVLIVAIAVSVGGTGLVLNKMNSMAEQGSYSFTGMATSDQGYARINIEDLLAIDVDNTNDAIDFGDCQLSLNQTENASIASHLTEAELNSTDNGINCSNSNLPAFIKVLNTGNVDAEINLTSDMTGSDLLTSADAEFYYKSNSTGDCDSGAVASYTIIDNTGNDYEVCTNLTFGGSDGVDVYVNLTVPNDASTATTGGEATLTFTGGKA